MKRVKLLFFLLPALIFLLALPKQVFALPTPSPSPSPTPEFILSPTPTEEATPSPTLSPTPEASPSPTEEETPTPTPEESPTPTPEEEEKGLILGLSRGQAIIGGLIIFSLLGSGIAFVVYSRRKPKKPKEKKEEKPKEEKSL